MYYRNTMAVILKLENVSESSGGLVKTKTVGIHNQRFWFSKKQRQSPRICISNKSPGDADAAGPVSTLPVQREFTIQQKQDRTLLLLISFCYNCAQVNIYLTLLCSYSNFFKMFSLHFLLNKAIIIHQKLKVISSIHSLSPIFLTILLVHLLALKKILSIYALYIYSSYLFSLACLLILTIVFVYQSPTHSWRLN